MTVAIWIIGILAALFLLLRLGVFLMTRWAARQPAKTTPKSE